MVMVLRMMGMEVVFYRDVLYLFFLVGGGGDVIVLYLFYIFVI